jgi:hypothetical protein
VLGDHPIKDRAVDHICLDLSSLETVETYITVGVDELADVDLAVFAGHKANQMSPGRHRWQNQSRSLLILCRLGVDDSLKEKDEQRDSLIVIRLNTINLHDQVEVIKSGDAPSFG